MKKKCLIIYPYFALYREHVFKSLFASDFGWDFELVGDEKCSFGIKGIDPSLANIPLEKGGFNWTFAKTYFPLGNRMPFQWQPKVLKRLLKKDYDAVIMLGSIYYLSYVLAIPLLKHFKIPIIFWTHGFLGKDNFLIKNIRHLLYKHADANLLYGNRALKIMRDSGLYDKVYLDVIYNSLDYGVLKDINLSHSEIITILKPLFLFPDKPLVVATGRITKEKKIGLLLDALEDSINKYGKYFNLLIIGDGPELDNLKEATLEKGIGDYVAFTGAIYGDKAYEFLIASDLCVIPGNVGLSAMHALSVGVPVISHNNFDIQMPEYEAIIEDVTGSFYEYNNMEDLISKIHKWVFDKNKLLEAASHCKEVIKEKYHVDVQVNVVKNCLRYVSND